MVEEVRKLTAEQAHLMAEATEERARAELDQDGRSAYALGPFGGKVKYFYTGDGRNGGGSASVVRRKYAVDGGDG